MKQYLIGLMLFIFLLFNSCMNEKKSHEVDPTFSDTLSNVTDTLTTPDSTIYGQLSIDDMGMSTFTLQPEGTDTLLTLLKETDKGQLAHIYGPIERNSKWAITLCSNITDDDYPTLKQAVNLTTLSHFTRHYKVRNAQIILGDTARIDIVELNDKNLIYKTDKGVEHTLYRLPQSENETHE